MAQLHQNKIRDIGGLEKVLSNISRALRAKHMKNFLNKIENDSDLEKVLQDLPYEYKLKFRALYHVIRENQPVSLTP